MRKKPSRELKKICDLLICLDESQLDIFNSIFAQSIDLKEHTKSVIFRKSEALKDIILNNVSDHHMLYLSYCDSNSTKYKLKVRYGDDSVISYTEKLRNRPKPTVPFSIFTTEYWVNNGLSLCEAKAKVSEIQTNNVKKRTKKTYQNHSQKIKFSVDYWTHLGYSLEETEILRQPFVDKIKNNLSNLIIKYGEELGLHKWLQKNVKYKESMLKNLSTRRTGGYVSKESIKFFIPLYKFCRRLGISRNKINFGITGSKEFFIKDMSLDYNSGKFYDFTIRDIKLIVEYHGIFWHPKDVLTWKNPWLDFNTAKDADLYKEQLARRSGMEYVIIWSDDNLDQKLLELQSIIKKMWEEKELYAE